MNREDMIDAIVKAYMESIEYMTDKELKREYGDWVAWSEETTEEQGQ